MIINGVICPKCGDFIFSRSGHDYHPCSCGTVFIDGGDVKNSVLTYERIGFGGGYSLEDIKKESIDLNLSRADLLKELDFEYEIRILTKDIFEKIKKINEEGRRPDLEEVMSMMYPERLPMPEKLTAYDIKDYMERAYKISRVEGIDANIIYEAMGKNNFKFSPVLLNDMAEKLNLPFFTEYRKMIGIFIREQEKIYYNLPKEKVFSKIKVLGHKIYKIYPQKTIITIFLNDCLERRGIIRKNEMVEIF